MMHELYERFGNEQLRENALARKRINHNAKQRFDSFYVYRWKRDNLATFTGEDWPMVDKTRVVGMFGWLRTLIARWSNARKFRTWYRLRYISGGFDD